MSPNPRQGGTAPITAQLLACRAARPGPARPTAARPDRRAGPTPSGRAPRDRRAVPRPVGRRGARPATPGPAGGAPPYRRAALPRRAARRPTGCPLLVGGPETAVPPYPRGAARRLTGPRPSRVVAPRLPCRPNPRGAARRPTGCPLLVGGPETAVPPYPREAARRLIGPRPSRVVAPRLPCRLSPWGGTAPRLAPPTAGGGCETAASLRSPAERRGIQAGCAVTVWRRGPETAVPPFPVGRHGSNRLLALGGWPRDCRAVLPSGAVRHPSWPRRLRVGLSDRRVAVSPRHGADPPCCLGTERPWRSLPVWAAAAEPPVGRARRDCRAVCPVGRRGT